MFSPAFAQTRKEMSRPPNGVRLSCGAELERSQTKDYLRKRGAGSFRRLLGGSAPRIAPRDINDRAAPHPHVPAVRGTKHTFENDIAILALSRWHEADLEFHPQAVVKQEMIPVLLVHIDSVAFKLKVNVPHHAHGLPVIELGTSNELDDRWLVRETMAS